DDDQGGGGGCTGHHAGQGGKEQGQQEKDADHHCRQAGTAALGHPGGALHVGGDGGSAQQAAKDSTDGVDHHDLLDLGQAALFIQVAGPGAGAQHGAHGVKEVDEDQAENGDKAQLQGSGQVELEGNFAQGLEVAGYVEADEALQPCGNAGYSDGNVLSQAVCFWTHSPKPANEGGAGSICGGAGEEPAQ